LKAGHVLITGIIPPSLRRGFLTYVTNPASPETNPQADFDKLAGNENKEFLFYF
jgi:hypothetical protein